MRAPSITDIDTADLAKQGYNGLILDLDNTLLPWKSSELPESSRRWVEKAKQVGFKPIILSNTHYPKRLNKIAKELEIPALPQAMKPREYCFHQAAKIIECDIEWTVVVGDQLITDIWGGNMACAYTILVNPMHPKEFFGTKISRLVENLIFLALDMEPQVGTKSKPTKSEEEDTK